MTKSLVLFFLFESILRGSSNGLLIIYDITNMVIVKLVCKIWGIRGLEISAPAPKTL